MSTVLEPTTTESSRITTAEELRANMGAVRLRIRWLGINKTLNPEQQEQAAATFGANGDYLSARKKLIDTRHPTYRTLNRIRTQVVNLWKGMTLPYPDPGLRLIRRDDIELFEQQFHRLQAELSAAVEKFERHFYEIKQSAQERLGVLFNPTDYPETLSGLFRIEVEYPNVEPPNYLRTLEPELYEEECRRITARFDEALDLAEDAFLQEFTQLIQHLNERLSGEADGKPKVFRDTAITNLTEFMDRFRRLNVRSSTQLDELFNHASQVIQGVAPQQLRNNLSLREQVHTELNQVQEALEDQLQFRPRRNIVRHRPQPTGGA